MQRMTKIAAVALVVSLGGVSTASAEEYYPKETETFILNYHAFSKSPATGYLLSAAPGFGAGHFYADNTAVGFIMLAGQAVGLGLAFTGPEVDVLALTIIGWVLYGGFKIADMVLAPWSVEKYNRQIAKRLKLRPLITHLRGGPPQEEGAMAYGLVVEGPLSP